MNDLNHPLRNSPLNPIWDGRAIALFSARNEIIAFQVVIQSNVHGATGLWVDLDGLSGPQYVIANAGPRASVLNYVGTRIEIFKESYISVTPDERSSRQVSGFYPDAMFQLRGLMECRISLALSLTQTKGSGLTSMSQELSPVYILAF